MEYEDYFSWAWVGERKFRDGGILVPGEGINI